MNAIIEVLAEREAEAADALSRRLSDVLGLSLKRLVLFGSKARGEGDEDSDIDILVIATREDGPTRHTILRLGARVSLEYDVLFNLFPISQERWQRMAAIGYPLYRSITRNGIEIPLPQTDSERTRAGEITPS